MWLRHCCDLVGQQLQVLFNQSSLELLRQRAIALRLDPGWLDFILIFKLLSTLVTSGLIGQTIRQIRSFRSTCAGPRTCSSTTSRTAQKEQTRHRVRPLRFWRITSVILTGLRVDNCWKWFVLTGWSFSGCCWLLAFELAPSFSTQHLTALKSVCKTIARGSFRRCKYLLQFPKVCWCIR